MHKGLPTGGSADEGKNGKELCAQWLHSAIAPNSDGRGQGHRMPIWVARTVLRRTVRGGPVCHESGLVSVACHRMLLAARCPATCLCGSPKATRGRVSWSAVLR